MYSVSTDYYAILGVTPSATPGDIRRAYRQKAMACHPDRGGRHADMVAVCEAAEVLLDPEKRALYDQLRADPANLAVIGLWRGVEQTVHAHAEVYPHTWSEFQKMFDAATGEVDKTLWGRLAAGAVAGALVGMVLGTLVGLWLGVGMLAGLGIGLVAGTIAGGGVGGTARKP